MEHGSGSTEKRGPHMTPVCGQPEIRHHRALEDTVLPCNCTDRQTVRSRSGSRFLINVFSGSFIAISCSLFLNYFACEVPPGKSKSTNKLFALALKMFSNNPRRIIHNMFAHEQNGVTTLKNFGTFPRAKFLTSRTEHYNFVIQSHPERMLCEPTRIVLRSILVYLDFFNVNF
jgi:hypothetical protein